MQSGKDVTRTAIIAKIALIALAYVALGRVGLLLAPPPGYATVMWPPAGIALAAVLLWGPRYSIGVFLGSCTVNLLLGFDNSSSQSTLVSAAVAIFIALGSTLQALIAVKLIEFNSKQPWTLNEPRQIFSLVIFGCLLGTLISASVGTSTLFAADLLDASRLSSNWLIWWFGDALGSLVFAPIATLLLQSETHIPAKRKWLVALPLLALFTATIVTYSMANDSELERVHQLLKTQAQDLGHHLQNDIDSEITELAGVKQFISASPEISRDSFRKFVAMEQHKSHLIHVLSWVPKVDQKALPLFLEKGKKEFGDGFNITERNANHELQPVGQKESYFPIFYIEPFSPNVNALGFDLSSNAKRKKALDKAELIRKPTATERIHLVQSSLPLPAVVVYYPVFDSTAKPEKLLGIVSGVIKIEKIFADLAEDRRIEKLSFHVLDENGDMLYVHNPKGSANDMQEIRNSFRQFDHGISVADRTWTIRSYLTPSFFNAHANWYSWIVLAGGMLLTGLLGILLLVTTGMTKVAEDLVVSKTSALSAKNIELENQTNFLDSLIENMPLSVFVKDANSLKFVRINRDFEQYLNLTRDEILGHHAVELYENQDVLWINKDDKKVVEERQIVEIHNGVMMTNRGKRTFNTIKIPLMNAQGEVTHILGLSNDISDLLAVTTSARETESRLQLLLNAVGDGVWGLDTKGKTTFINPMAAELLGYQPEELVDCHMHTKVHHSHQDGTPYPEEQCFVHRSIHEGSIQHVSDEVLWRKDGSHFPVEYTSTPIKNPAGKIEGAVIVFRDVSFKRAQEKMLAETAEKLRAASENKSHFLAAMSHDLRTPLNSVLGFSNLLLKKVDGRSEREIDALKSINRSGKHLLSLINDILDLSKIEAGKLELRLESTPLSEIIESVCESLSDDCAGKNVALRVSIDARIGRFITDATRFRQIAANLISNAVKYTEKGSIDIRLQLEADEQSVSLHVEDTGIGIREDDKSKLFSEFNRASNALESDIEGTGLGLVITSRLTKLLGGHIKFSSTYAQGSHFTVTLPRQVQNDSGASAANTIIAASGSPSNKPRVLIVEDNLDNQNLFRWLLDEYYQIAVTGSAEEGLEYLASNEIDLVLMDIGLPGMNGKEAIRQIRANKKTRNMPVIAVTAHAIAGEIEAIEQSGVDHIVAKPINETELLDMMKALLEKS